MIQKTKNKIKKYLDRIVKILKRPEMIILPGNIAFALILSIFPAVMVLGFVISKLNISSDDILNLLSINIPKDINELIVNFLYKGDGSGFAFITFIVGLYFSGNGTKAIITSSNILYKAEDKNALKREVKSFFLVILLMSIFAFTTFILGFGSKILRTIIDLIDGNYDYVYVIFTILKWPLSFFLIYFFVKILYVFSPSIKIKSSSVTTGALFTTIGWMIATFGYSLYVSNVARYDIFYGSLSSIIVLMIWVYILSTIFVIGITINAEKYLSEKEKKWHIKNMSFFNHYLML